MNITMQAYSVIGFDEQCVDDETIGS